MTIDITTTVADTARRAMESFQRLLPGVVEQQTKLQAMRLKVIMVRGIRDGAPGGQAFKPLASTTKLLKGSSKPLIDNGDLLRSIDVDEVGHSTFFVGVNRNAPPSENGTEMVNLAEIHNNGTDPYTIQVTPKLRKFFMFMYLQGIFQSPLSKSKTVIHHKGIPARPFIEPSYEEWSQDVERQLTAGIISATGMG